MSSLLFKGRKLQTAFSSSEGRVSIGEDNWSLFFDKSIVERKATWERGIL